MLILEVGLTCLHAGILIEALSLEGLPSKATETLFPHKVRLLLLNTKRGFYKYYNHYYHDYMFIQGWYTNLA